MSLTFRLAEEKEVDEFLELLKEDAWEYLEKTLTLMGETWDGLVAIAKNVGEVYTVIQGEEPVGYYWIEARERVLHLHGIVVRQAYRGQGVGTAVLEMLSREFSEQLEDIELGVHDSNQRAIRLYERLGFVTVRRLEALGFSVMQKRLRRVGKSV